MIRHTQPPPDLTATTTEAHVRAVAKECGLPVVPAGEWLYVIRRVPLLGAPIVYRAKTSQPTGLSKVEGEADGKQGGVHPDRAGRPADGPDQAGLHTGSGVLAGSGLDPHGLGAGLTEAGSSSPSTATPTVVAPIRCATRCSQWPDCRHDWTAWEALAATEAGVTP